MLEKKKFNELVKSVERYESKKSLSHRRAKSTRLPRDFEFYKLNETKEKGKNEKKYLAYIYLDFCLPLFHIPNVYIYIYTRSITHIYKFLGKYRKYISNICQGKRNKYREIVKLVVNEAIHILEIQQMLNRKYEYTRRCGGSCAAKFWVSEGSRIVSRNECRPTKCVVVVVVFVPAIVPTLAV